jgi:hypothetical protein
MRRRSGTFLLVSCLEMTVSSMLAAMHLDERFRGWLCGAYAGYVEPIFFQTFRWLFDGVTFRTEGMYLLLPVPTLYRRKPIVKDVRIRREAMLYYCGVSIIQH